MNRATRRLIALLTAALAALMQSPDAQAADSLRAHLLTCSPGKEIYSFYGHTALRIENLGNGQDITFNYGLFDFDAPCFVWRFLLGQTDYMVGACLTSDFLESYRRRGSSVQDDALNLTQDEVQRLFTNLLRNCEPDSCVYRYNFFYDNCATRPLRQIEQCLDGQLEYTTSVKEQSLRDIVHEFSAGHPWSCFGQDLLLGAEADRKASRAAQQFAPIYLEHDLSTAVVKDDSGRAKPLVSESTWIVEATAADDSAGFPISPTAAAIALLAVTAAVSVRDLWQRKVAWLYDASLMLMHGIMGLLICFMFLFSSHPTVDSNWLVMVYNPLPLIFLWPTIKTERRHRRSVYHTVARYVMVAFAIIAINKVQYFADATIILAITLLLRSISYHTLCRLWKDKRNQQPAAEKPRTPQS